MMDSILLIQANFVQYLLHKKLWNKIEPISGGVESILKRHSAKYRGLCFFVLDN